MKRKKTTKKIPNRSLKRRLYIFSFLFSLAFLLLGIHIHNYNTLANQTAVLSYSVTYTPNVKIPIAWNTKSVTFTADAFFVEVNGKKFQSNKSFKVTSAPEINNTTTLDVSWTESGIPMRVLMTFIAKPSKYANMWSVQSLKTYDGTSKAGWITYEHPGDIWGYLGKPMVFTTPLYLFSTYTGFNKNRGRVHFSNPNVQAFLQTYKSTK